MGISRASASKVGRARRSGSSAGAAGAADAGQVEMRSGEAFVSRCLNRLRLSEAAALVLMQGGVTLGEPRRARRRVSRPPALPAHRMGRISEPAVPATWRNALAAEQTLQARYPLVRALLEELAEV